MRGGTNEMGDQWDGPPPRGTLQCSNVPHSTDRSLSSRPTGGELHYNNLVPCSPSGRGQL